MSYTNKKRQIATADVCQCTKKTSWRKKANKVWRSISGSTQPERTAWSCQPGYKLETTLLRWMVQSDEVEKDKIWALQRRSKDWISYNLTIYMDGLATNGTAIGGGGILVTTGHRSNHTIYHSYDIPAETWCSSFQAKMKAIKNDCKLSRQKSPQKV